MCIGCAKVSLQIQGNKDLCIPFPSCQSQSLLQLYRQWILVLCTCVKPWRAPHESNGTGKINAAWFLLTNTTIGWWRLRLCLIAQQVDWNSTQRNQLGLIIQHNYNLFSPPWQEFRLTVGPGIWPEASVYCQWDTCIIAFSYHVESMLSDSFLQLQDASADRHCKGSRLLVDRCIFHLVLRVLSSQSLWVQRSMQLPVRALQAARLDSGKLLKSLM